MDERARRIGLNEALFREVNEKRQAKGDGFSPLIGALTILCECGDRECVEEILMTPLDYETLRAEPETFAVVRGHDIGGVETVVSREDRYDVVRKTQGDPAALARQTDPRG